MRSKICNHKYQVMIIIKDFKMSQISASNNPLGVDMPLNKPKLWIVIIRIKNLQMNPILELNNK